MVSLYFHIWLLLFPKSFLAVTSFLRKGRTRFIGITCSSYTNMNLCVFRRSLMNFILKHFVTIQDDWNLIMQHLRAILWRICYDSNERTVKIFFADVKKMVDPLFTFFLSRNTLDDTGLRLFPLLNSVCQCVPYNLVYLLKFLFTFLFQVFSQISFSIGETPRESAWCVVFSSVWL